MIDSPVDVNHSALKGQKVKFKSFHNAERKPGSANRGTAVTAMLVGKPAKEGFGGILPEATLFAANMFEINDRGKTIGNAMGLLKSLDWLATKKPTPSTCRSRATTTKSSSWRSRKPANTNSS